MVAASMCFFAACNTEEVNPDTPFIEVDQTIVDVPSEGGEITLTVTANRPWKLTDNLSDDKWLIPDKTAGDGDAVITLTVAPNAGVSREADIRIATSTVYVDVRITQPGAIATQVIYYEDMGKTNVSANTDVTDHTGWSKEGLGGSGVTYEGNTQVRTTNASAGYAGAGGGNNVFFGTVMSPLRHFIVKDIALSGVDNIELTFGVRNVQNEGSEWAGINSDQLAVSYSPDNGATWHPVSYTTPNAPEVGSTAVTWALATAQISTTGISSLSLKWECAIASVVRIDDIKVVSFSGTPGSSLNISPTSANFTDAGGTENVTITSNTAWTITPDAAATWAAVTSSLTGSNNGAFTVTVTANTGAQRAATITVKTNDNAVTRTFAITQAAPETPQASLLENWESGEAGQGKSAAINGWKFEKVQGDDDKIFELREYSGNKYAYASAHNGTAANYELWLISPALDVTNAATKTMSFKTVGGYFNATSSLEVYLLNSKSAGTANGTKLTARIAESTDPLNGSYTDWIFSGEVDLSSYSGTKYIGFRYVAEGGASKSTTYEIDDFRFGATAPKELTVTPASLSFSAAGEDKSFNITSNTAWTITPDAAATWAAVTPSLTGSDNGAVTVTAAANTGSTSRSATITVSGTGVTGDKTIAVTQAGVSSGGTEVFTAAWNMTGIQWGAETMAVSSNTNSNVTIGALTKTGFTTSGNSGNNNWGGNDFSGNTEANKLSAPVKYATFTISSTGAVSLSALEIIIRLTGTGPLGTSIQYQIGTGSFEEVHAITFTKPSSTTTFPKETVSLSAIAALQNVAAGTTITIRIVPYILSTQTGTITGNWYLNSANASTDALTISGN
jgi:hypothetical protein